MAAVLSKTAAAAVTTDQDDARKRAIYAGGTPVPVETTTLIADYQRMHDALTLVKADAAYSSLDTATKAAVVALGF